MKSDETTPTPRELMEEKDHSAKLAAVGNDTGRSPTETASTVAGRYFDASNEENMRECELEEALLAAFGIDIHATPWQPWRPFDGFVFDDYDASFELRNVKDDAWFPTEAQLRAVFALGFGQGWVVYNDQTERFYTPRSLTAERRKVGTQRHASDSEKIWKIRKQLAAAKASTEVSSTPAASPALNEHSQTEARAALPASRGDQMTRFIDCALSIGYFIDCTGVLFGWWTASSQHVAVAALLGCSVALGIKGFKPWEKSDD